MRCWEFYLIILGTKNTENSDESEPAMLLEKRVRMIVLLERERYYFGEYFMQLKKILYILSAWTIFSISAHAATCPSPRVLNQQFPNGMQPGDTYDANYVKFVLQSPYTKSFSNFSSVTVLVGNTIFCYYQNDEKLNTLALVGYLDANKKVVPAKSQWNVPPGAGFMSCGQPGGETNVHRCEFIIANT